MNLVSFADKRMQRSLERLARQARDMNAFDNIFMFTEDDLSVDFRLRFKDKLIPGSRGFGYWSWKPEIILSILDKIPQEDCLLYIDAGCHLNIRGRNRLLEYFKILQHDELGIIAFQAIEPTQANSSLAYDGRMLINQPNYRWIKGDLLDYFEVRNDPQVINSQAIGAGIILIRNCEQSKKILREWQKIILHRFDLLDDTSSVSPNLPGFIENRHDQSIWTLLCLKYGVKTLSAYEYWYPSKGSKYFIKPDWRTLSEFPILAKRDKDLGLAMNLVVYIKSMSTRFVKAFRKFLVRLSGVKPL